jgi:DnaJ-class molecular chaperone
MQFKDYYKILNISQDATDQDIKKAFRRLALQHHPDHNPDNPREAGEKFKEINEAYEILGDDQKRWQYDRLASLSEYRRRTTSADYVFGEDLASIMEMFRGPAGMNIIRRPGWGKLWGCGRRQGGQCRRQWKQDID